MRMALGHVALVMALSACQLADPDPVGAAQQAASVGASHACTLSTLPSTCGVPATELPCCAVDTTQGEEQMDCCPAAHMFVRRLCAAGRPSCPDGSPYPCAGVICPPLSWRCPDGPGCCNDCGQIGPRGCSICERVSYDNHCDTIGAQGADVCVGSFDAQGVHQRVILPDGSTAPE